MLARQEDMQYSLYFVPMDKEERRKSLSEGEADAGGNEWYRAREYH